MGGSAHFAESQLLRRTTRYHAHVAAILPRESSSRLAKIVTSRRVRNDSAVSRMATEPPENERVKIEFDLTLEDHRGYRSERLWVERVGHREFRLLSSPFFVFGVSAEDIVRASTESGRNRFDQVVRRGATYAHRPRDPSSQSLLVAETLAAALREARNGTLLLRSPPG
jgi:hypothetical protein